MKEIELVKNLVDKYDVVSFDIFDTALLRNVVKPTDIFKILEKKVKNKYNIDDFLNIRIKGEENSRTEENNYETSLDEIYESIKNISNKIKNEIKNMEIEIEKEFLRCNPFIKEVYDYAKKKKKKVIFISDMYLPQVLICELLNSNGYKNNNVYVSCEYRKHKGDMSLYKLVENKEKIEKSKWIHIGDNYYSDYTQAQNFGISAYYYKNVLTRSKMSNKDLSLSSSIIYAISCNEVYNGLENDYWNNFGKIYAAPIYYAFSCWVYKNCLDKDNIYFLARDGYMIKKVFDKIQNITKTNIYSSYFYASRRAVQLPLLLYEDKTAAINMLCAVNFQYDKQSKVKDIFKVFDLDAQEYIYVIKKYGFNDENDVITEKNHIYYCQLISELYDTFKIKMKEQVDLIEKYIEQENVNKFDKMNVVDIGWRGSIQYALTKIVKNELYGYYLCTGSSVYNDMIYNTRGFLLNYNQPYNISKVILDNMMLFEFLFSSPEGTLKKYDFKDGKVVPILSDNKDYINEVGIIQQSSLEVIDKYLKYFEFTNEIDPNESFMTYSEFLERKDYDDVKQIANLSTNVGYSGNNLNFVNTFTKNEIENNLLDFFEGGLNNSMWKNTFIVKEIDSKEEFEDYKKKIQSKYKKMCKIRFIKKLRPRNIMRVLKRKIKGKISL